MNVLAPLAESDGTRLAQEWITAWNAHDLDAIMALYTAEYDRDERIERVQALYRGLSW